MKHRIWYWLICLLGMNMSYAQDVSTSKEEGGLYHVSVELLGAGINTLYTVNLERQVFASTVSSLGLRAGVGFMKDRGWNSISVPVMLNKRWGNQLGSHFLSTNIGFTYYYGGPIIIDTLNPVLNFDYDNSRFIYNFQIGYAYRPLAGGLTAEVGLTSYMGSIVSHSVDAVTSDFVEKNTFRTGFWPHFSVGYLF